MKNLRVQSMNPSHVKFVLPAQHSKALFISEKNKISSTDMYNKLLTRKEKKNIAQQTKITSYNHACKKLCFV